MIEFIAPTKRRGMTKARAANIFLVRNGKCFVCGRQIRSGERWTVEHPEPLSMGGSDADADLWPVHERCGISKTSAEAAPRSKRNNIITAGWQGKRKRPMPGSKASGWRKPFNGPPERRTP